MNSLDTPTTICNDMLKTTSKKIFKHLNTLESQPTMDFGSITQLAHRLTDWTPPEKGEDFEKILNALFEKYIPKSVNTISPYFFAYIPGGGLFPAALADFIDASMNRYMGVNYGAPLLSQLEANVVRWFCTLVGYNKKSRGVLTSGGSIANLIALLVARQAKLKENITTGTVYLSEEGHFCIEKSAKVVGIPLKNIRYIKTNVDRTIDLNALEKQIYNDKRQGFIPFLIVGNLGTINTGAIDDMKSLKKIANTYRSWFHIDAAYGGFFALTSKHLVSQMSLADSIVLDPHKTLFMPYGVGAVLVKDGLKMLTTFSYQANYVPDLSKKSELWNFSEMSPELSRNFRGLKIWICIKLFGLKTFRKALNEKLTLTSWLYEELRKIDEIQTIGKPSLTIVPFKWKGKGTQADKKTKKLLELINSRKRVHFSGTVSRGEYLIRPIVLSFRTHLKHVKTALSEIKHCVRRIK